MVLIVTSVLGVTKLVQVCLAAQLEVWYVYEVLFLGMVIVRYNGAVHFSLFSMMHDHSIGEPLSGILRVLGL